MDTRESLKESQTRILGNLIQWELKVAELYDRYSVALSDETGFWKLLAEEERGHARMLDSLNKQIVEGHIFWNIGKFSPEALARDVDHVIQVSKKIDRRPLLWHEAVANSVAIETTMLERGFYDTVTSDAKEFQVIASALKKATEWHIQRIRDEFHKLNPDIDVSGLEA